MRIFTAALSCFLQLASALIAAEPALVKLAVSEGKDIRFARLTSKEDLPPATIRNIDREGELTRPLASCRITMSRAAVLW